MFWLDRRQAFRTIGWMARRLRSLVDHFRLLSVARQFAMASILVIGFGMIAIGLWVNSEIKQGVMKHTALATALYMQGFVEPHVQELRSSNKLSQASSAALLELLSARPLREHLEALKIWLPDGTVAFSRDASLIGRRFPIEGGLAEALNGRASPELDDLASDENELERKSGVPLLEIYVPLNDFNTGRIVAVGEFYLRANELKADLEEEMFNSWGIVGLMACAMVGLLSLIMLRASRTIDRQQISLNDKVAELSQLLDDNRLLNQRIAEANHRAADLNDQFLGRIGSDLHDGPAQLLSVALMRLDEGIKIASRRVSRARKSAAFDVRRALRGALQEIRYISAGLVLPEIENLTLAETLKLAISTHESLTGTVVDRKIVRQLPKVSRTLRACVYRLVQEGLNNAFKHAGGQGQTVRAETVGSSLYIEVGDTGPGFNWERSRFLPGQLGLVGVQNRILALGGSFDVKSSPDRGTLLVARIDIEGLVPENKEDQSPDRR